MYIIGCDGGFFAFPVPSESGSRVPAFTSAFATSKGFKPETIRLFKVSTADADNLTRAPDASSEKELLGFLCVPTNRLVPSEHVVNGMNIVARLDRRARSVR